MVVQKLMSCPSLLFLSLIFTYTIIASSQTQPPPPNFIIRRRRSEEPLRNFITLSCVSTVNAETLPNARFFLNGVDVETLRSQSFSLLNDNLILNINRDLEGNYSCGFPIDSNNVQMSVPIPLVAYPNPQIPPSPQRTFFAEVGSTGVLNCSLAPGRFLGQYYVTWTNTSQGFTYREIPRPSLSEVPTTTPFDPRYSINPVTFSLAISDVTLADSDPNFFCILGVEDPSERQLELIWEQSLNVPLRLVVYKQPRITTGPTPLTVSLETTNQVRFTCTAVGQPAPKISWRYNGVEATSELMFFASQTNPSEVDDDGLLVTTGMLVIFALTEVDSTWVECVAGVIASDETTGGQEVPKDTQGARLSVLGSFLNIEVIITQDGDVIYIITLRAVINTPVSLLFVYYNADDDDDDDDNTTLDFLTSNQTTTISYNNTEMITHMEFKSRIPFPRFVVSVALTTNSVTGPLERVTAVYDLTKASVVSASVTKFRTAIAAGVPLFVLVIILLFILIVVVISCIRKCRKSHLEWKKDERYITFIETQLMNERLSMEDHERLFRLAENVIVSNCELCDRAGDCARERSGSSDTNNGNSEDRGRVFGRGGVFGAGGRSGKRVHHDRGGGGGRIHFSTISSSMSVMFKSALKNSTLGPGLREEMMRMISSDSTEYLPVGNDSSSGSNCSIKEGRESCV